MGKYLKRITDYRISSRLYFLGTVLVVFLALIAYTSHLLFNSGKALNIIANKELLFVKTFDSGIEEFYKYELSGGNSSPDRSISDFRDAGKMAFTFAKIDSLISVMPENVWENYFYNIFSEGYENDMELAKITKSRIKFLGRLNRQTMGKLQGIAINSFLLCNRIQASIDIYNQGKTETELPEIQNEFSQIHGLTQAFTTEIYSLNDYISGLLKKVMISLVLVLSAITFVITRRISVSISKPVYQLVENFKKIATGNLKSTVNIDSQNEIGELSNAFSKIQVGLQNIIAYSQQVSKGDYKTRLPLKSDEDELSIALNKMITRLERAKNEADREHHLQAGLGKLDDQTRGNYTVSELAGRIITFLCDFLDVQMGALYIYDEISKQLNLAGSTGLNLEEVKEKVSLGEGLVGKAATQDSLQILNTRNKFSKIYSATGEMEPANLYLLPLHYNKQLQAVIELAPIYELTELNIEFLKLADARISITLNAAVARARHKELLDRTLEQAEILKQREEELSRKLEENNIMQERLQREKALLDAMLKTLPDYVYFKDTNSKFLRISQSMVKLFKAESTEQIIGKDDFDFHPRKAAQIYFDEEQEIIRSGKGFIDIIRQGINENGDELWTSVTKLPMYDETGTCIGTFGISKDVTDIKKLEMEVHERNRELVNNQKELEQNIAEKDRLQSELVWEKSLLDALMQNIPDSIYFKDKESRFVKISKSLVSLFGVSRSEEIEGKTDFDFQSPEHAREAYDDEQRIIKTQKPVIGIVEKEIFNGRERFVSTTKLPLLNSKGEVLGTFGISRDITMLKKLELEIKKQNEILQTQQEELKVSNEELKSQEEELRVANEELAEHTRILRENERSLQQQQEELRVVNEDLEAKTVELEEQKKEISNKNDSLLAIQEELKQKASELELSSRYKSEFLANMSHELRTPLNSMLILSKLIANNKKGNLDEEQLKSINIIHKSGNDLLSLINEILDLSKIEAGKMTYEFEDVDIREIETEIQQSFKPVASGKRLSLEINKARSFPKTIYTDRQRLMQVIKNLLSNALKFTGKGGIKVTFVIPPDKINFIRSDLKHENACSIAVEDTGVGIPKNKVDDIFEAFKQADGSISRKFGGTGLGLSISRQLAHALGGEIHLKSTEGVGSVFTVYLPIQREVVQDEIQTGSKKTEEGKSEPLSMELPVAGQTAIPVFIDDDRNTGNDQVAVLIIHPDKEKAETLLHLSHKRKFRALVAANIKDGIILAEEFLPNAIILSANLKDLDEFNNLRENKATKHLPVHLVTKIEDTTFDSLEELKTPESIDTQNFIQNLEHKIRREYNQVLVVEDNPATLEAIHMLFKDEDIIIHDAKNGQQAYDLITTKTFDCIILDLGLPDFSGQELLKRLDSEQFPIPNVIIHTARELSEKEQRELHKYSDSIVIKGVKSDERLLDEVTLFLHQVATTLPTNIKPLFPDGFGNDAFKGKKILIVDDDIRNIFALAQILEEKEMEVLEAENGEIALEILKNNKNTDLILMDIMMPVMDGYETMKKIRSTRGIENIPIITLTAKAMKEDYQKAINNGANDYISKPVDIDKLFSLLKIWLFK